MKPWMYLALAVGTCYLLNRWKARGCAISMDGVQVAGPDDLAAPGVRNADLLGPYSGYVDP